MKKASLILIFLSVILFSCKKDSDAVGPADNVENLLLGNGGWFGLAPLVSDEANGEFETSPPFMVRETDRSRLQMMIYFLPGVMMKLFYLGRSV